MRIKIKTLVRSNMTSVWQAFDRELFIALSPKYPKVEILRFDGCLKGNEVHLKLLLPFFPQYWFAEITENEIAENEIFFIDKGTRLPFFLSKWRHKHRIVKVNHVESIIIDEIYFSTGTWLTDRLLYPFLYKQFSDRVPIYKKYFDLINW